MTPNEEVHMNTNREDTFCGSENQTNPYLAVPYTVSEMQP